ncbi:hypothetical protein TELCIR_20635, partial [Teladorsagia circumcincta]
KYFKNEQWAEPGGPIFLMIGGESAGSPSWVLNGNLTYLKWAKKFNATVYFLEHRYYGDSHLFQAGDAFKTKTYASYLSSMQMLYDVANFIRTVNVDLDEPAKWIVFGGSYAEYLQVVEASIRSHSKECADTIAKGFEEMHQLMLTVNGRQNLSYIFT